MSLAKGFMSLASLRIRNVSMCLQHDRKIISFFYLENECYRKGSTKWNTITPTLTRVGALEKLKVPAQNTKPDELSWNNVKTRLKSSTLRLKSIIFGYCIITLLFSSKQHIMEMQGLYIQSSKTYITTQWRYRQDHRQCQLCLVQCKVMEYRWE